MAARMEEAFDEQGKLSWITPSHGVVVEGEPAAKILPGRDVSTPDATHLIGGHTNEVPKSSVQRNPVEEVLQIAAEGGMAPLQTAWLNLTRTEQRAWKQMLDTHFKPIAEKADRRELEREQHGADESSGSAEP
jgi:hypothetical protein